MSVCYALNIFRNCPLFCIVCVGTFWKFEDTYIPGATSYGSMAIKKCRLLCIGHFGCVAYEYENGTQCWLHEHRITVDQHMHKNGIDHYQVTRCIFPEGKLLN